MWSCWGLLTSPLPIGSGAAQWLEARPETPWVPNFDQQLDTLALCQALGGDVLKSCTIQSLLPPVCWGGQTQQAQIIDILQTTSVHEQVLGKSVCPGYVAQSLWVSWC